MKPSEEPIQVLRLEKATRRSRRLQNLVRAPATTLQLQDREAWFCTHHLLWPARWREPPSTRAAVSYPPYSYNLKGHHSPADDVPWCRAAAHDQDGDGDGDGEEAASKKGEGDSPGHASAPTGRGNHQSSSVAPDTWPLHEKSLSPMLSMSSSVKSFALLFCFSSVSDFLCLFCSVLSCPNLPQNKGKEERTFSTQAALPTTGDFSLLHVSYRTEKCGRRSTGVELAFL